MHIHADNIHIWGGDEHLKTKYFDVVRLPGFSHVQCLFQCSMSHGVLLRLNTSCQLSGKTMAPQLDHSLYSNSASGSIWQLRKGLSHPNFKEMAPPADGSFALATADDICGLCSCLKIIKHLKSNPNRPFNMSCSEFEHCPRQCSGWNHEGWGHGYDWFITSIESLWHLDSTNPQGSKTCTSLQAWFKFFFSYSHLQFSYFSLPIFVLQSLHSNLCCSSWGALHGQLWDLLSHFKWHLPPVMDMCHGDIAQLDWASQSCLTYCLGVMRTEHTLFMLGPEASCPDIQVHEILVLGWLLRPWKPQSRSLDNSACAQGQPDIMKLPQWEAIIAVWWWSCDCLQLHPTQEWVQDQCSTDRSSIETKFSYSEDIMLLGFIFTSIHDIYDILESERSLLCPSALTNAMLCLTSPTSDGRSPRRTGTWIITWDYEKNAFDGLAKCPAWRSMSNSTERCLARLACLAIGDRAFQRDGMLNILMKLWIPPLQLMLLRSLMNTSWVSCQATVSASLQCIVFVERERELQTALSSQKGLSICPLLLWFWANFWHWALEFYQHHCIA